MPLMVPDGLRTFKGALSTRPGVGAESSFHGASRESNNPKPTSGDSNDETQKHRDRFDGFRVLLRRRAGRSSRDAEPRRGDEPALPAGGRNRSHLPAARQDGAPRF